MDYYAEHPEWWIQPVLPMPLPGTPLSVLTQTFQSSALLPGESGGIPLPLGVESPSLPGWAWLLGGLALLWTLSRK